MNPISQLHPGDLAVERHKLVYAPSPDSIYREEQLPPPGELEDNSLAFRSEAYYEPLRRTAQVFCAGAIVITVVAILFALLFATLAQATVAVSIGLSLSLILIVMQFTTGNATLPRLSFCLFAPPSVLLILVGFGAVINESPLAFAIIAALGAIAIAFSPLYSAPFRLMVDYMLAQPKLLPETRANFQYDLPNPNVLPLIALLVILIGASVVSPGIAAVAGLIAMLALLAITENKNKTEGRNFERVRQMMAASLGLYLSWYNRPLPGLWTAQVPSLLTRRFLLVVCLLPLFTVMVLHSHSFALVDAQIALIESKGVEFSQEATMELTSKPLAWVVLPFENAKMWLLLFDAVALILLFLLPTVAVYLALYPLAAAVIELEEEVNQLDDDKSRSAWRCHIDRLLPSEHEATDPSGAVVKEAEHLYMGFEPTEQVPLLLDPKILSEHAYIVGNTGSGKTSLGIMPLLFQLLERPAGESEDSPIVILDLKGDPALFNLAKEAAEARAERRARAQGKTEDEIATVKATAFRFFSPEKGKASHSFNPFPNLLSGQRSIVQLATLFLDALSLNHGEGYGRSYYSRKNRMLLLETLTEHPEVESFDALYKLIRSKCNRDEFRDAFELVATLSSLTQYAPLNPAAAADTDPAELIHFPDVLEHGQVIYFWLPAALESVSIREIGKLALYSLLTACIDRQRAGKPVHQTYLFIDEFQRLAGENFKIVLEQARSFGLGAILCNQSISDLVSADADLRPTVRTNTRLKMNFGVTDPDELKYLSETSGQELAIMRSYALSSSGEDTKTYAENIKAKITINDLLSLTDSPTDYLLHVTRGGGYTQYGGFPVMARTSWPVTWEVYQRASNTPLPDAPEQAPVVNTHSPRDIEESTRQQFFSEISEATIQYQKEFPELR